MLKRESGCEALDVELLIRYVVSETEYDEAVKIYQQFRHHPVASSIFRNYYTELPEGREEMVCDLRVIAERQGAFICAVKTTAHHYLYVGSSEAVEYVGSYEGGIEDEDVLLHFGFQDKAAYSKQTSVSFEKLSKLSMEETTTCVVCGVAVGETHIFGCPVEQCPWCDGQLNRCNCRFDQLGVEAITDDEMLDQFEEMLSAKGRVVFKANQNPSYPTAGNDPAPGEIK